eukprot:GHVS01008874.1.p1 GENE.GHVS01008874.1~~GHVS01008874.1.p1  ORF type:complete len:311 (+),score=60.14 GHVS01008874.1:39-971(+)
MESSGSSPSEEKPAGLLVDPLAKDAPIAVVIIGMAGSGKTTFVKSFHDFLKSQGNSVYAVNLDPAVQTVPFPANIDIRDSLNYKEVMKEYKLGPNGAIMTCLNLFATRIDSFIGLLEKRAPSVDYILIDTPGQIEVFNWSASGTIVLDGLSVCFPTVVIYVVDTARCQRPITFMSNMMYACSVMYKTKLPFIMCFNKIDVVSHQQCLEWMDETGVFQEAIKKDDSYMASLSFSCALALCEFYKTIKTIGVSAATGAGHSICEKHLQSCKEEYSEWLPKRHVDTTTGSNDEELVVQPPPPPPPTSTTTTTT